MEQCKRLQVWWLGLWPPILNQPDRVRTFPFAFNANGTLWIYGWSRCTEVPSLGKWWSH